MIAILPNSKNWKKKPCSTYSRKFLWIPDVQVENWSVENCAHRRPLAQVLCQVRLTCLFSKFCQMAKFTFLFGYFAKLTLQVFEVHAVKLQSPDCQVCTPKWPAPHCQVQITMWTAQMSFRLLISRHTEFFSVKTSAPKNQIPHPFSFLLSLLNLRLFGLVLLGS